MEWPAHHLLRQACSGRHGPLNELCDASVCSSRPDLDVTVNPKFVCSHCSSSSQLCSSQPYYPQSSGLDSLAAADAVGGGGGSGGGRRKRKGWRHKCVSYSRLGGWWVLAAETLGTIILIALCVVAANQARSMSEEVDTVALAALAHSNPRAICVNASRDNEQGRIITNVNVQLVPSSFKDSNGRHLKRAAIEAGMRSPSGLWSLPLSSQTIPLDAVFTQSMLAAAYKCGVIRGGYHSQDLPSFISRRCKQCRIEMGASLNHTSASTNFAGTDDINTARARPALEVKTALHHMAFVANTTQQVSELLNQLYSGTTSSSSGSSGSSSSSITPQPSEVWWVNDTSPVLMWAQDDFLPGLEAIPQFLDAAYDVSRLSSEFVGLLGQLQMQQHLHWMEAALYLHEDQYHVAADHSHNRHMDPRAVPAGTLRVDVFQTLTSNVEGSKNRAGQHVSSVFFELAPQTAKTAHCMAETATLANKLLRSARYMLRQPNGTSMNNVRPRDANITYEQLWLRLDANVEAARPYACAEGVDVTSAEATAYLTRLDAYKSAAKSQYRTTIFVSMHNQTSEDLIAIYTGALGAVFGSMALLVSTLFVYALALAQRAAVEWHDAEHERDNDHPA